MEVYVLVERKLQRDFKNKRKISALPFTTVVGVYQSFEEANTKKVELNSREEMRFKTYHDYYLDFIYEVQKHKVI